jgi:MraZ protein
MFIGEYRHNLDAKNRLIIPSKFREQLSTSVVIVTEWMEGCLAVFTEEQFSKVSAEYSALPISDLSARTFQRMIHSKASESDIDGQGRILLPTFMIKDEAFKKACVVVGAANYFEIWPEEKYEEYMSGISLEESAAKVTELMKS